MCLGNERPCASQPIVLATFPRVPGPGSGRPPAWGSRSLSVGFVDSGEAPSLGQIQALASIAPGCTVNAVRASTVVGKYRLRVHPPPLLFRGQGSW